MVGHAHSARETAMNDLARKPCSECGGRLRPRTIAHEFEREGIRIRLSGIRAWVCSRCGEVYFLPGGAGRLAKAARSLFELAPAGRQHRGKLTARIT
jgi:YgiT-type zinc finger domain-containing protein